MILIPTFRKIVCNEKISTWRVRRIRHSNHWRVIQGSLGVAIKNEIETRLSRQVSIGAMHTALGRLEDKGYVKSFNGEGTEERMGRPRRYFQITALGKKAMEYSKDTRNELWRAIPKVALDLKRIG